MPVNFPANNEPASNPISPEQGLDAILSRTRVLESLDSPLMDALSMAPARQVFSSLDVPPFTNSAMDGYAVRSLDLGQACETQPTKLQVIGRIPAGSSFDGLVGAGQAVEIMTGAPVPDGADAVVRVEDTSVGREGLWEATADQQSVAVYVPVTAGNAVRKAGADVGKGALLADAGFPLSPAVIGRLASCGLASVTCHRRPRIAICTTGDEAIPVTTSVRLQPGQIYDSNSPMLLTLFREWNCDVTFLGHLPDDRTVLNDVLQRGLTCDYLITVGGVSMGRHDYVRGALSALGMTEVFWKLNQQPGGPMLFGTVGNTMIFGLPGNPVSCYVCAELYLRPSLRKAAGFRNFLPLRLSAALGEEIRKPHGKTAFLRGRLSFDPVNGSSGWIAGTTGPQASNLITSIVGHHGYIVFPAHARTLAVGETVEFIITDPGALVAGFYA